MTTFSLKPGALECDAEGLRIASLPLLRFGSGAKKEWRPAPESEIELGLAEIYGVKISPTHNLRGLSVVAEALNVGNVAKAQIAALLLKLPDPPAPQSRSDARTSMADLLKGGGWLSKDWDPDKHPRAGPGPNPGWFAGTDQVVDADAANERQKARLANISCDDLLESDIAICHSAIFSDDHHHRGLCVQGALQRNRECLRGLPLSPLLPY